MSMSNVHLDFVHRDFDLNPTLSQFCTSAWKDKTFKPPVSEAGQNPHGQNPHGQNPNGHLTWTLATLDKNPTGQYPHWKLFPLDETIRSPYLG